jgi:hypothetical protein
MFLFFFVFFQIVRLVSFSSHIFFIKRGNPVHFPVEKLLPLVCSLILVIMGFFANQHGTSDTMEDRIIYITVKVNLNTHRLLCLFRFY